MPKEKIVINYKGKPLELFLAGELAYQLGRTTQTIRRWEIAGILPKAIFKDVRGRRLYTREQIDTIVRIAEETKIAQGYPIANTSFSKKVYKALEELNKKYK